MLLTSPIFFSPTVAVTEALGFLPRLAIGVLVFVIGFVIAKWLKRLSVRGMQKLLSAKVLDNTPIDELLEGGDLKNKIDVMVGNVVFWLVLLFTLYLTSGVVGFVSLNNLLASFFDYIPNIVSASVVMILGIILAGFAESFIKGSLKAVDPSSARLIAKMSSYVIVVLASMIALSELGIARDFILILFIGFTFTMSLVVGLGLGLGSKDLVKKILDKWYQKVN